MAKKNTRRRPTGPKKLKRGQAIRVPGAGTVTITTDGAVLFRGTPLKPNPTRRRKATRKTTPKRKRVTAKRASKKRTTKKHTTRRARR